MLSGLEKLQPAPSASERSSEAIAPQQAPIGNGNGNGHNAANYAQQPLSTEPNFVSSNGVNSISTAIAAVLNSQREAESSVDSDVQLLSPYQDLTLPDAIALLLEDNAGTILKLDFIVRSLYGKLPAPQVDTVTERVREALEAGVEEGRWQRDALNHPDNSDCYTWKLPLQVELTPSTQITSAELSDSSDSDDIDEEFLALPIIDEVVSEKEFLELVEKGFLNFNKMKQIAQKLQFRSYGTIKSPEVFAAFLGRKSIKRSVIQPYL